jgi:hypothetical protein
MNHPGPSRLGRVARMGVFDRKGRAQALSFLASPKPVIPREDQKKPLLGLSVHDLKGLRMSNGFCGMAMRGLRFPFGLKHQCYPSVLTGFEMETKAIWNRLNLINLHGHIVPPSKTPINDVSIARLSSVAPCRRGSISNR